MKKTIKNITKLGILLFGISIAITSCQKDDAVVLEENSDELNVSMKESSYDELFKSEVTFRNAIDKITPSKKGVSNSQRTIMEANYGFTIIGETVKIIETDNIVSYTMLIEREEYDASFFENLVIEVYPAEDIRATIIKYNLNTEVEYIEAHNSHSFDADIEITPIEFNNNQAKYTMTYGCVVWTLMCPYDWDHPAGSSCLNEDRELYWVSDFSNCVPDDESYNTDVNSPGGNYVSGGGGSSTGIVTNPIPTASASDKIIFCFELGGANTSTLTDAQIAWLKTRPGRSAANNIFSYLDANNCSPDAQQFTQQAIQVLMDDSTLTFEEFIEQDLNNEIEINPYLLLDIDCDQIDSWITLVQHTAPSTVLTKINALPGDLFNNFAIQTLNGANGTMVNLDYFPVKITTLPNNPVTGTQFTADQFLDYFRRNINNFMDGSTFEPYCETTTVMCTQETQLWESTDPTGAIIYIDIPFDDGVVVCSEYSNDYWFFMTMNAPGAGNHPVSGTRQFGYELNSDGSYNFFVRGVDRFDLNTAENAAYMATVGINPFFGADSLWESFQEKLNDFVNDPINGGNSTIVTPVKNRPDWDEVKDVLEGRKPISDLGCN